MASESDKVIAAILTSGFIQKEVSIRSVDDAVQRYHDCLKALADWNKGTYDPREDDQVRRLNDELRDSER